ncbi:MAG: phosphohistidine phosphatase SixA [bacterium]
MELYLIRHADAEPIDSPGVRCDAERALTLEGKREFKKVASGLKKVAGVPNLILTSPFVRARQTAEILRDTFGLQSNALQQDDRLAAGASPQNILYLVNEMKRDRLVLVGHEPDFSRFISATTCGHAQGGVAMKKGGVARIDFNGRDTELIWLLPPKITKVLAE